MHVIQRDHNLHMYLRLELKGNWQAWRNKNFDRNTSLEETPDISEIRAPSINIKCFIRKDKSNEISMIQLKILVDQKHAGANWPVE